MPTPIEILKNELANVFFDHHSPLPLYHQVYSFLRELIESGKLQPGDLLPSEADLTDLFNVGRQTVRKALSNLVNDHMLERYAGKGTFVCDAKQRNNFYMDRSFSQQLIDMGLQPYSKVLRKQPGNIDETADAQLIKKAGSPCLYLDRIRYGNDMPVGLQYCTIITERCPDIARHDFTTASLFNVLTTSYHLQIAEIYHVVNAILADEETGKLLGTAPGAPLLIEKSVTYLADGEPIEATNSYYRADKYEYSIRFQYRGNERFPFSG
jgi:GntR family transcriptional regulator, N-acetylglucosamine utilization regulator